MHQRCRCTRYSNGVGSGGSSSLRCSNRRSSNSSSTNEVVCLEYHFAHNIVCWVQFCAKVGDWQSFTGSGCVTWRNCTDSRALCGYVSLKTWFALPISKGNCISTVANLAAAHTNQRSQIAWPAGARPEWLTESPRNDMQSVTVLIVKASRVRCALLDWWAVKCVHQQRAQTLHLH